MLKIKKKASESLYLPTTLLLTLITVILATAYSSDITNYVKEGLKLCYNVIIGSVFPFMIITDILCVGARFDKFSFFCTIFEKTFKINGAALSAFLVGILCGFPIGVKVALDLYRKGTISKDECERLISFSNNTGPAFLIGGIGAGMRGSLADGIILYIAMILSAIAVGFLLGIGKKSSNIKNNYDRKEFDLINSTKSAMNNTLLVCAFVILFSVIGGFIGNFVKNEIIYSFIIPFFEIGNASRFLSKSTFLSPRYSLILNAFAVSFSGLSVHMQAKSLIVTTDVTMKYYYFSKLLQGLIAALICTVITI